MPAANRLRRGKVGQWFAGKLHIKYVRLRKPHAYAVCVGNIQFKWIGQQHDAAHPQRVHWGHIVRASRFIPFHAGIVGRIQHARRIVRAVRL